MTQAPTSEPMWSTIIPQSGTHNRTPIYRAADPLISPTIAYEGCYTLYEILRRGASLAPLGPCLGFRAVSSSGFATPFVYSSYTETVARVDAFAAGLDRLNLVTASDDGSMNLLGFFTKNCVEWVVAEHACFCVGATTVPFYATLGPGTVEFVLNQTGLSSVVATREELSVLLMAKRTGNCPDFRNVILVDGVTPEATAAAEVEGVALFSFAKVEAVGGQVITSEGHKHRPPSGHDVATFCYTSGTTGNPKGALITHTNLMASVCGIKSGGISLDVTDRHLSYMPLPHIFERVLQAMVFACGASIGFFRGEASMLLEDIVACRPTIFIAAPRVLSKIYDKIVAGVEGAGGLKAKIFKAGLETKSKNLLENNVLTHALYDALLFNKIKAKLGMDHVRLLISGSAPLAPHVMIFFRVLLGVPVVEGYGQTEGAAAATVGHADDMMTVGHVGGVHYCCEVCLEDVPEMGYYHTDTQHRQEPCVGRGEVCIRGPNVFKGYYKQEQKTRETVDTNGWLHSGDIGMWMPNGQLKIIDRKKNIFKLAQGEYVAPEKIENIITQCPLVAQAFVHGDSLQRYLVAVLVPDEEVVMQQWVKEQNSSSLPKASFAELCQTAQLKQAINEGVTTVARKNALMGFEVPRAIHLESDLFSVENGLLTPTFKVKRKELRDKYEAIIAALYDEINQLTMSKL